MATLPDDDGATSGYQLVHNLDRALLETFPPSGACRAIAPFVDADGSAAARLHERCELTVIVDAENIAASEAFFAGPWTVEARAFEARLHGKAYEVTTPDGRWVRIGSPNLSTPALLDPARAGNLEVAVAVTIEEPLELPPSTAADSSEDSLSTRPRDWRRLATPPTTREPPVAPSTLGKTSDESSSQGCRTELGSSAGWMSAGTRSERSPTVVCWSRTQTFGRPGYARCSPDGSLAFAVVASPRGCALG